jgi:hypothetical protein
MEESVLCRGLSSIRSREGCNRSGILRSRLLSHLLLLPPYLRAIPVIVERVLSDLEDTLRQDLPMSVTRDSGALEVVHTPKQRRAPKGSKEMKCLYLPRLSSTSLPSTNFILFFLPKSEENYSHSNKFSHHHPLPHESRDCVSLVCDSLLS